MFYLEELVANHHKLYKDCYGRESFTPKMHMIVHLVEQVRQHGPARHHWTMRFEGKNAVPKAKNFTIIIFLCLITCS